MAISKEELLKEIFEAFKDVELGNGISLHETEVLDMYGTKQQRIDARKKDTDRHWTEVKDDWIESIDGIGGMSFFDKKGFHYYIPAYMSWYLRKGHGSNLFSAEGIFFALSRPTHWGFEFFSLNQKRVICKFLQFCVNEFHDSDAQEALHCYWYQYGDQ